MLCASDCPAPGGFHNRSSRDSTQLVPTMQSNRGIDHNLTMHSSGASGVHTIVCLEPFVAHELASLHLDALRECGQHLHKHSQCRGSWSFHQASHCFDIALTPSAL